MVQLPPPVHGASLRNQSLAESKLLHENFEIKLAPLSFADSIYSIGKPTVGKIAKMFIYAFRLFGTLISFKPRVAYFTLSPSGCAFYRDCCFVVLLKMFRVKILYHLRGFGIKSTFGKNSFNKRLLNFVFKNVYVICLGKNQLADIEGLPYKKHFVVPNGIRIETKPEWIRFNQGKKKLLFLSNFIKSKGVYEFLGALEKLNGCKKNFEALLVGEEYDITAAELNSFIANKGLDDCVEISGPRYKEEKFKTISASDIFIFPTYYSFELFPGVVLEAMQCGKPVISTRTGAITEIIDDGKNGFLVEPRNIDQLAEKISYLIDHPEEALLMGKNAKEKFHAQFTLEKFEQNMNLVFQEVSS